MKKCLLYLTSVLNLTVLAIPMVGFVCVEEAIAEGFNFFDVDKAKFACHSNAIWENIKLKDAYLRKVNPSEVNTANPYWATRPEWKNTTKNEILLSYWGKESDEKTHDAIIDHLLSEQYLAVLDACVKHQKQVAATKRKLSVDMFKNAVEEVKGVVAELENALYVYEGLYLIAHDKEIRKKWSQLLDTFNTVKNTPLGDEKKKWEDIYAQSVESFRKSLFFKIGKTISEKQKQCDLLYGWKMPDLNVVELLLYVKPKPQMLVHDLDIYLWQFYLVQPGIVSLPDNSTEYCDSALAKINKKLEKLTHTSQPIIVNNINRSGNNVNTASKVSCHNNQRINNTSARNDNNPNRSNNRENISGRIINNDVRGVRISGTSHSISSNNMSSTNQRFDSGRSTYNRNNDQYGHSNNASAAPIPSYQKNTNILSDYYGNSSGKTIIDGNRFDEKYIIRSGELTDNGLKSIITLQKKIENKLIGYKISFDKEALYSKILELVLYSVRGKKEVKCVDVRFQCDIENIEKLLTQDLPTVLSEINGCDKNIKISYREALSFVVPEASRSNIGIKEYKWLQNIINSWSEKFIKAKLENEVKNKDPRRYSSIVNDVLGSLCGGPKSTAYCTYLTYGSKDFRVYLDGIISGKVAEITYSLNCGDLNTNRGKIYLLLGDRIMADNWRYFPQSDFEKTLTEVKNFYNGEIVSLLNTSSPSRNESEILTLLGKILPYAKYSKWEVVRKIQEYVDKNPQSKIKREHEGSKNVGNNLTCIVDAQTRVYNQLQKTYKSIDNDELNKAILKYIQLLYKKEEKFNDPSIWKRKSEEVIKFFCEDIPQYLRNANGGGEYGNLDLVKYNDVLEKINAKNFNPDSIKKMEARIAIFLELRANEKLAKKILDELISKAEIKSNKCKNYIYREFENEFITVKNSNQGCFYKLDEVEELIRTKFAKNETKYKNYEQAVSDFNYVVNKLQIDIKNTNNTVANNNPAQDDILFKCFMKMGDLIGECDLLPLSSRVANMFLARNKNFFLDEFKKVVDSNNASEQNTYVSAIGILYNLIKNDKPTTGFIIENLIADLENILKQNDIKEYQIVKIRKLAQQYNLKGEDAVDKIYSIIVSQGFGYEEYERNRKMTRDVDEFFYKLEQNQNFKERMKHLQVVDYRDWKINSLIETNAKSTKIREDLRNYINEEFNKNREFESLKSKSEVDALCSKIGNDLNFSNTVMRCKPTDEVYALFEKIKSSRRGIISDYYAVGDLYQLLDMYASVVLGVKNFSVLPAGVKNFDNYWESVNTFFLEKLPKILDEKIGILRNVNTVLGNLAKENKRVNDDELLDLIKQCI